MNTEKTGGAAFPETKCNTTHEGLLSETWTEGGMTLLDYFAAKTMESALSLFGKIPEHESGRELIAKQSYKMAAAMIEERKKYINQ
jgi:hypothetical protein